MTEEFNLSEKGWETLTDDGEDIHFKIEDVKEFIRRLKEELQRHLDGFVPIEAIDFNKIIDKLAGSKLK